MMEPPFSEPGCHVIRGRWGCSRHIMWNGQLLHVACSSDTFCGAWHDDGDYSIDFVTLNGESRTVTEWSQAETMLNSDARFAWEVSDEEVAEAAQRTAALLADMEAKTT